MNGKTNVYFKEVIYTNTYLNQKSFMNNKEVEKLERAIDVHGYRGSSKMKHNGVVLIKPDDKELLKSMDKFKLIESDIFNGEFFADVKIVAHVTNGNRAIGCIYKNEDNELILYVLGFSNYNKQLF
jgi:hypothetical protein